MAKTAVNSKKLSQKNFDMDEIAISIIAIARFYTTILSRMVKVPVPKLGTMGVGFNSQGKIALCYDPEFIKQNTLEENQGVTVHEILHIFFRHLSRLPKEGTPESKYLDDLKNLATDMAINPLIELPLPKGGVYPEQYNLPRDKSAEWYFEELKKLPKKECPQCGSAMPQPPKGSNSNQNSNSDQDSNEDQQDQNQKGKGNKKECCPNCQNNQGTHDMWDKVVDDAGNVKDFAEAGVDIDREYELETLVIKAIKDCKDFGNLPAFVMKEIREVLKGDENLWRRQLKMMLNTVLTATTRLSYKKANRRFVDQVDYYMPGPKKDRKPRVLLARDTSGSVFNDESQDEFLSEMIAINKRAEVIVADCDTQIHQVYKVKSKKDFKTYKGGGGTSFEPIFDLAKKLGVDGVIYLTDTEGSFPNADEIGKFRTKTIWATIGLEEVDIPFGRHVNIPK